MPAQTKGVFYIVSFLDKINRLQRLLQAVFTYVRGFEPPTPWSVAKCSIQLSYTYNASIIIAQPSQKVKHFFYFCISSSLDKSKP